MSKYMAFDAEAFANRKLLVEALKEMGFERVTEGNGKSDVFDEFGSAEDKAKYQQVDLAQPHGGRRKQIRQGVAHITHVEQPEIFFKAVETFLKGDFPVDAKKVQTSTEKN